MSLNNFKTIGLCTIFFGFFGFFSWAALSPLHSAAIAPGLIVVEGKKQEVQHYDGGIIKKIHVKESDTIAANQLLIELDGTKANSNYSQLKLQYYYELAKIDRLKSELALKDSIDFSDETLQISQDNRQILTNQKLLFQQRKQALEGSLKVLKERINQAEKQAESYTHRVKSEQESLALLQKQINMIASLLEKGFAARNQYLEMESKKQAILGRLGEYQSKEAEARLLIVETEQELLNNKVDFLTKVSDEIQLLEIKLAQIKQALTESKNILSRTKIYSPIAGKIVDLNVNTIGAVISPGKTIVGIIPTEGNFIVEGRLNPKDIDEVRLGQTAMVRLSSYDIRKVSPISAIVIEISPDLIKNQNDETSYYRIKVKLDPLVIKQRSEISLYPGMPAEIMILLQERTTLDYLLNPVLDSMNKGMRES
ncbi:HlyD family type I secretion periplasmic adaptor subunit [Vibrio europaeus]|uniref:HlyD family type I secretion periplasmic adaptor subunit n=1 Tax=Vibrio europaeus TaxID=300876 RepID=UPI00148C7A58|nr:HlyD family type I secretion periplasmic adaptor subunit [Vibrio europaeus]NOH24999.1 HlyD family type I secretion periplasmic adaptor subunit [Vibrio europaeus]